MQSAERKACCLRILDILGDVKSMPQEREDLEKHLAELHRLITLVDAHKEYPAVRVVATDSHGEVGNTVIAKEPAGIKITATDIPGLADYLAISTLPNYPQSMADTVEYLKVIQENHLCLICLRRSSLFDATIPLVVLRHGPVCHLYHLQCYEEAKNKDTL